MMAFILRAFQVKKAKERAREIFSKHYSLGILGTPVKQLNFLRGDYEIESDDGLHFTVNIRTGLVIPWESQPHTAARKAKNPIKNRASY
jgi:hypothetical protein